MQDAANNTVQALAGTAAAITAGGLAASSLWDAIGMGPAVLFMALTGTALGLLWTPPGGTRARLFSLALIFTVVSAAIAVFVGEVPHLEWLRKVAPLTALLLAFFAQTVIPTLRDAINARIKRFGGEGGFGGKGD